MNCTLAWLFLLIASSTARAQAHHHHDMNMKMIALTCMPNERLNLETAMCDPLPVAGQDVTQVMAHGNLFVAGITQSGPRGRDGLAAPNMAMADAGSNFGSGRHFFNLGVMLTGELWTFPRAGYPELFQSGEHNRDDQPYIDAQHPHSSPVMGLTASDTIRFNGEDGNTNLTLSFSPRGASTEGPIAFMHRPTGQFNPDVPLGHHIGQDVGHITSTVLAASLATGAWTFEASTFNGREPEPNKVDLPMRPMNSAAGRVAYHLSPRALTMGSIAYVKAPEDGITDYHRQSISLYTSYSLTSEWEWLNTLIYGHVENFDGLRNLNSLTEEFAFTHGPSSLWGRFEALERAAIQLDLAPARGQHWVNVATVGYTHALWPPALQAGASITQYFLPQAFTSDYGHAPWAGRVFLQFGGMVDLSP